MSDTQQQQDTSQSQSQPQQQPQQPQTPQSQVATTSDVQQLQQNAQQQAQQSIVIRQTTPVNAQVSSDGTQQVTPQALLINTANIAQQQAQNQAQIQQVATLQQQQTQQAGITLQQSQQISLQQAQSGQATQLTSIPIQMATEGGGGATILQIPQSSSGAMNTMQPNMSLQQQQQQQQQQQAWEHNRVQVIQPQQLQNSGYLQYNTQGQQLIVPGNITLHNPGSIQVFTAGKPLQSNQIATGHMFAQGKQVIAAQGQPGSFPSYAIPTTTNQTLLISQLGVISSQPNIIPAQSMAAVGNSKQQTDLQKVYTTCGTNRTVQQSAQPFQLSQWQFGTSLPQGIWATTGPQQPTLLTQNPIFIRGAPQQDGSGQAQQPTPMFIQSPPPQHLQAHHAQGTATIVQGNQTIQGITQVTNNNNTTVKSRTQENIQPKVSVTRMPAISIRPGSSVSTQTNTGVQGMQQMVQKTPQKVRPKAMMNRTAGIALQKSDASNQTKTHSQQQQHIAPTKPMIITSSGTLIAAGTQFMPDKMQIQQQTQQIKVMQQQQQQQQQQVSQQMVQQLNSNQQQQQITYQQTPQMIQPKPPPPPLMSMTIASPQQQIQIQQQSQQQQQQLQQNSQQLVVTSQHQQVQPGQQQQIAIVDRSVLPVVSVPGMQQCQQSVLAQIPQIQNMDATNITVGDNTSISIMPQTSQTIVTQAVAPVVKHEPTEAQEHKFIAPAQNAANVGQENCNGISLDNNNNSGARDSDAPTMQDHKQLPKALVKPQVLTHVIEGYVIQEADEPFPVYRSSLMSDLSQSLKSDKDLKHKSNTNNEDEPSHKKTKLDGKYKKCEKCDAELKSKHNKKYKRFCSAACWESSNRVKDKDWERNGKGWDGSENNDSGAESSSTPSDSHDGPNADVDDSSTSESLISTGLDGSKVNPFKWTVSDVCEFIRSLPECCEYADDFAHQEIDGQALMLLKVKHLITAMQIKLGPALKIVSKINTLKDESQASGSSSSQTERQ